MKKGICLAAILIFSTYASAHPGKTDRYDGHKCRRNCGEWELYYGEYHLHDKDRKPIRVNVKDAPIPNAPPLRDIPTPQEPQEQAKPLEQTAVPSPGESVPGKPERSIINEYHHITVVRGKEVLSLDNLLLLALAFLLLSALIFIRRKQ